MFLLELLLLLLLLLLQLATGHGSGMPVLRMLLLRRLWLLSPLALGVVVMSHGCIMW